jgi:hypothetical protein
MARWLSLLMLLPQLAWAGPMSGTWVLDKAASDDYSPLLLAQGLPAWQVSLAARMGITQEIDDQGERIDVVYRASMFSERQAMTVDGAVHTEVNKRGLEQQVVHRRESEEVLASRLTFKTAEGVPVVVAVRRVLTPAGDGFTSTIDLTLGEQETQRFVRVFQRKS